MRNFSDKHRARELSHGVAETHEETASLILRAAHRGSLNGGGNNHNDATNSDGGFAPISVAEERYHGEGNDGTDRVHGAETTQSVL